MSYFALYEKNAALVAEKADLEKEVARLKAWEDERERYALTEIAQSVFVYALKESARTSEPLHWLCSRCYQEGKKGILNLRDRTAVADSYVCPICQNIVYLRNPNPPTARRVPVAG